MRYETLNLEIRDRIARLTLARPETGNTIDGPFCGEFASATTEIGADPSVRVILIAAEGPNFSLGGDVKVFAALGNRMSAAIRELVTSFHVGISRLARAGVPIVAAVQGACAGGGFSLALLADVLVAAENAKFTAAYARIGLSPDGGLSHSLTRAVGVKRALDLVLTNRLISAREAFEYGIVSRVVVPEDLAAEAASVAGALASGPPIALRHCKRLILEGARESLETQLENEAESIVARAGEADAREGITALLEMRTPRFGRE
jgi:2-(1,2-epoxy-1,2-dihydrophenyl)acetyl-CoA isomerase